MRSITLTGCTTFLGLILGACSASPATDPQDGTLQRVTHVPTAAADGATAGLYPEPLAGLRCKSSRPGWATECSGGDFDVTGVAEACGNDSAAFGVVTGAEPIDASDRLSGDAQVVATLGPQQLVCIYYWARNRSGDGDRLYAVAVPPSIVAACRNANCGDAEARSRWTRRGASECRFVDGRYSTGCPAGWVPRAVVEEFSMGLGGALADGATDTDSEREDRLASQLSIALPDTTLYAASPMRPDGTCVVGAEMDELGRQTAVAHRFEDPAPSPAWSVRLPPDPEFHQSRATHCGCDVEACYVLVATDTHPAHSLSQTSLAVARISTTGQLLATRRIERIPGAPPKASAWSDADASNLVIEPRTIAIKGQWRASPDEMPRPFAIRIPRF